MPRFVLPLRLACLGLFALILCGCQLPFFSGKEAGPGYAKNPCLVLALPASGPYSPIAGRIRAGAELAARELAAKGTQIRIENINTDAADWISRLASLPEACAVVGGPLQDKSYVAARNAGLLEQRVFFTFTPTLGEGDEGVRAWRFFPGPADQVDAVTDFVTDRMNIRTFGAFYPEDNYGRRMTGILEQRLRNKNISLQKAGYNPKAAQGWTTALQPLILPTRGESGQIVPQTMFEALFVPDSWKNMDMITNALSANGEDRLVLMGTTLWEQGLAGKQVPKAEKYALAIFPGAWLPASAPASLRGKGNNFWNALGYDFINFAAAVALDMRPQSAHVTARAQKAAANVRGLAPMHWDNAGQAHQRMYLFQITPSGMTPADQARLANARTAAAERAALRMQGWSQIEPEAAEAPAGRIIDPAAAPAQLEPQQQTGYQLPAGEGEAPRAAEAMPSGAAISEPVNAGAAAQPAVSAQPRPAAAAPANEGIMRSAPRPSYKLSLPARNQE
ncbi:MAG: hypothetical protein HDQ91_05170 [Desulfovibrio sp.]|nr:hypothetical protein [Desulfovibrio sp.]